MPLTTPLASATSALQNSTPDEQEMLLETLPSSEESLSNYVSPYDLEQPPIDYLIIHNRSKNAVNYATELKNVWPNLKIIQVVEGNREKHPRADHVVSISDWTSMEHFKQQFNTLAASDPALQASIAAKKVGFYCVWSAAAENADWAQEVQNEGFIWIGASPDKMRNLDKITYKEHCLRLGLPTAPFIKITRPPIVKDDEALHQMASDLIALYHDTPALAGKDIFVKHIDGGGGRGTQKVPIDKINQEDVLAALRKIISETGGNLEGVYAELALDLEGATLYQIEIESDGPELAFGARLVWFNRVNQKVLEVGFSDRAILEFLPPAVYKECRRASQAIFEASGYDSRGTNEILLVKDKNGHWFFYMSELNKRIQVENEALSRLVTDTKGRCKNVAAEQVMRACGYPAPKASDYPVKVQDIMGHIRLLSCDIKADGKVDYPSDLVIDGASYPPRTEIRYAQGSVYMDADPQIGRALLPSTDWENLCDNLLEFAQNFQFVGPKTELSTYFSFFQLLASDHRFRARHLGCNQTFGVLRDKPLEPDLNQHIAIVLDKTVTPLVVYGYRAKEGVKGQSYPRQEQIAAYKASMANLPQPPKTPFSEYMQHRDNRRYIADLKAQLAQHGGGTVAVIRDVQQSQADQESALIQEASGKIAAVYLAGSGIGVGFETGGAQYQAGLMRGFDWWNVLLAGCLPNLASHSLTRSAWLNGLDEKSLEVQTFVFKTIAQEVSDFYGFPADTSPFIPWAPYNFHAGNHEDQDITTRAMLKANLAAMPNWAWDSRYTEKDFRNWVIRQITLFKEEGKPLNCIRIKNPGQNPDWSTLTIVSLVEIIREEFKKAVLEDPIIYIHNHEFNGQAASIAAEALRACQAQGYRYLVVDSAPPGTSHNSNLTIAEALDMTLEERKNLDEYNRRTQHILDLTARFNNQALTKQYLNPNSKMAGGTISSDYAGAIKMNIAPEDITPAIELAYELTGLGTPVTPYSEWIKQVGFAIWTNKEIQPKTAQTARAYIERGGQLLIAESILQGLQAWKTMLPRPPIVEKLLQNHGLALLAPAKPAIQALDIESERSKLQDTLRREVTNKDLATYFAFGSIGLDYLKRCAGLNPAKDIPRDLTPLMSNPEFVYSEQKKPGDSFTLFGKEITLVAIQHHVEKGTIEVIYAGEEFQNLSTSAMTPERLAAQVQRPVRKAGDKALTDKTMEVCSPFNGKLHRFFVPCGEKVVRGQAIATIEVMKLHNTITSPITGTVTYRNEAQTEGMVDKDEVLMELRADSPSPS